MTRRTIRQAHVILPPRSMSANNWPDWLATAPEPRPLSWADAPDFLRSLVMAVIAVVVGIMIAPFVWAWLS